MEHESSCIQGIIKEIVAFAPNLDIPLFEKAIEIIRIDPNKLSTQFKEGDK